MSLMDLTLPRRTPPQRRIQESLARFKIAAWGRQSGKTTNGGWTLLKKPLEGRANGIYWHILQTHSAAEVAFNRYVKLFPKNSWQYLWGRRPNESEKAVYLTGGREVSFKSGDNYQDLRIETLDGAIIDECRQQDPELWTQIIRPMLGRHKGWCDFYSTPNGFDWFYDLFTANQDNPEWGAFHAPSTEAFWWTPEEIASARATMSEAVFAQEIMAEFRDLTAGKAYLCHGPHNQLRHSPFSTDGVSLTHPLLPIVVGLDFNINPMAWTLGQKRVDQFYWFDEIFIEGSHTQEAAAVLVERVKHHAPGLIIAGDATANASQRAAAGKSDYDILFAALDKANIKYENRTPDSNPQVKDRVNNMNSKLKSADNVVNFFYHPERCPRLKRDLERVVWKESSTGSIAVLDQKTDKTLTHSSDGVGYAVYALSPIEGSNQVGTLRIIRR